jgi:glycosyltransferase involved in cell wall biosynthesis
MTVSNHDPRPETRSNGPLARPRLNGQAPVPPPETGTVDLTLFVACYNEEGNIVDTLDNVLAALAEAPCKYEIIVVDDASRDRSVELIEQYQRTHPAVPITLRKNPVNRGWARNFVDAAFLGKGTYYRGVCGDNVEPKETLLAVFANMGRADMVIPYHTICEGKSAYRMFLSRLFTRLVNLISGHAIYYYNGLPLFRRQDVLRWHSHSSGFGFQADLVTRLLDEGVTYKQVLVQSRERATGTSKALTLRNVLSVGHTLLEIFLRRVRRALFTR